MRSTEVPLYEVHCTACGERGEIFTPSANDELQRCGICGGILEKDGVQHFAGFKLKGGGFHRNDYGRKVKGKVGNKWY